MDLSRASKNFFWHDTPKMHRHTWNINKPNSVYVVIYLEISYLKFSSKYIISRNVIKIIYLLLSIRVYQNLFLQINHYYTSTPFSKGVSLISVALSSHFCTWTYHVMVHYRESSDFPQDSYLATTLYFNCSIYGQFYYLECKCTGGNRIWTCDLKIMSLTSYQTALSRYMILSLIHISEPTRPY